MIIFAHLNPSDGVDWRRTRLVERVAGAGSRSLAQRLAAAAVLKLFQTLAALMHLSVQLLSHTAQWLKVHGTTKAREPQNCVIHNIRKIQIDYKGCFLGGLPLGYWEL